MALVYEPDQQIITAIRTKNIGRNSAVLEVGTSLRAIATYTNSINDCNTSLGKDAMNRVSTNGLFVAFFFQIGIISLHQHPSPPETKFSTINVRAASPRVAALLCSTSCRLTRCNIHDRQRCAVYQVTQLHSLTRSRQIDGQLLVKITRSTQSTKTEIEQSDPSG
ncbi:MULTISPECIES: hypothetical protein [unclassified Nostoc]|uniref:hypothetical protein n=1 Tax=unclassified Nostoc TaxID=2593658 RepID=UPI001D3700FD|nr:hypothetical protein [Nostoc sp. JL23]MBN3879278.1 hypothetical protein [Nostoc sp. JL23]